MRKLFTLGAVAIAAATTTANAEVSLSGNVALTSDYHWRGMTQSNEDMAIQGGFDLETDSGFYAGTWASSIDFGGSEDIEWDLYAGFGGSFGESGVGFDVGVIQYLYPSAGAGADLDFVEVYGGLSYEFEGGLGIDGYGYYDPDNETFYLTGSAGLTFVETDDYAFGASVGVGQYVDGGDDLYAEEIDYNIGATYSVAGFDFDLRFYSKEEGDDNTVFSIAKSL